MDWNAWPPEMRHVAGRSTVTQTRSRLRNVGVATLVVAVALGAGALTVATAAPASAAAIDKTINYTCVITDGDLGGDGVIEVPLLPVPGFVTARTRTTMPDEVAAGETIPETAVQIDIDVSAIADAARITFGTYAKGGSSNTQTHFGINGTDHAVTLQNLQADWMLIPNSVEPGAEPAGTWVVPVEGAVPPVTVPGSATGTITVDGPEVFTIDVFHNDTGVDPFVSTSHLECSSANADELRLGTIDIAEPELVDTTLAGTAAPSAVDKPVTVTLMVSPAAATGTVSLAYQGSQVGSTSVLGGAASIAVPAATLPVPGTYVLEARYSGDATHHPSVTNVTVIRTALAPVANTVLPTISDTTPTVGQVLTVSDGTWDPSEASLSYQWLADGVAITGAMADALGVTPDLAGKRLSVRVTASMGGYADGVAESVKSDPVDLPALTNTVLPTISDTTPTVGQVLTVRGGDWDPEGASLSYRWLADGSAISGATTGALTVTPDLEGTRLSVRVTASKGGFADGVAESDKTDPVSAATPAPSPSPMPTPTLTSTPSPTVSPVPSPAVDLGAELASAAKLIKVKGKAKVGKTLRLSGVPNAVTGQAVQVKIQWFAGKKKIRKATKAKLKVAKALKGTKLTVRVTLVVGGVKKTVRIKIGKVK